MEFHKVPDFVLFCLQLFMLPLDQVSLTKMEWAKHIK